MYHCLLRAKAYVRRGACRNTQYENTKPHLLLIPRPHRFAIASSSLLRILRGGWTGAAEQRRRSSSSAEKTALPLFLSARLLGLLILLRLGLVDPRPKRQSGGASSIGKPTNVSQLLAKLYKYTGRSNRCGSARPRSAYETRTGRLRTAASSQAGPPSCLLGRHMNASVGRNRRETRHCFVQRLY